MMKETILPMDIYKQMFFNNFITCDENNDDEKRFHMFYKQLLKYSLFSNYDLTEN